MLNIFFKGLNDIFKNFNKFKKYSLNIFSLDNRSPSDSLSILDFLVKNGNTFVYQWRTGVEPKQVEKPKEIRFDFGDEQGKKINYQSNF
jgi:hypothetical protein